MSEFTILDPGYSTTRRVIKAYPQIIAGLVKQANKPEDKFETVLFLPEGEGRQAEGGLRTQGYFKAGGLIPNESIVTSLRGAPATRQSIDGEDVIAKQAIHHEDNSPLTETHTPETKTLITVVTVVYNGEKFLEETILSVINQTYDNVEYIIIDGGSTDGTLDIIKKYEHAIDYWVSKKDKGIYDAMNKGIYLATGEWINFMNASDRLFLSNTLAKAELYKFLQNSLVYGNKVENEKVIMALPLERLKVGEIMACHQSMFFNLSKEQRKDVYYDLSYKVYGDYELVNRLFIKFNDFKYIDQVISVFGGGGVSSVVSTQKRKDKYRALYFSYGFYGFIKGIIYRIFK